MSSVYVGADRPAAAVRLPAGPVIVRRVVELLAVAAFAVGVYEVVVAGALALWPGLTDSWILLLWITAATVSGLGMHRVRRLAGTALRRVWPATAGPSRALVAVAAAGAVTATTAAQLCTEVAAALAAGTGARRAVVWRAGADGTLRAAGGWPDGTDQVAAGLDALGGLPGADHVAPVSDDQGPLGALVLTARSGRGVSERDRRLAADAAGAVAPLLRGLRLTDELARELAREQEQQRRLARSRHRLVLARDVARARLGDEIEGRIGQALAASTAEVGTLLTPDGRPDPAGEVLATVTDRINIAIVDFRRIVHGFYPAVLTDHGLASGLENLVSELPWPATFEAEPLPRFDQRLVMGTYFCLAAVIGSLREVRTGTPAICPISGLDLRLRVDAGAAPPVLSATVLARVDGAHPVDFPAGTVDPDTVDAIDDRVGALDGRLDVRREPTGLRLTLSVPVPGSPAGPVPDPITGVRP